MHALPTPRSICVAFLIASAVYAVAGVSGPADRVRAEVRDESRAADETGVRAFVAAHCARCHDAKVQKGMFRIDDAPFSPRDPKFVHFWAKALERVSSGEMPPEKEKQPTAEERARLGDWIAKQSREAESLASATADRVSFRKLSRDEYGNTLHDLLGVTFVAGDPGNLPEDPNWRGFERIGPTMTISPAHIERHLAAAEIALEQLIPSGPPPARSRVRWDALGIKGGLVGHTLENHGLNPNYRILIPPNQNARLGPGGLLDFVFPVEGDYEFLIRASGLRPPKGNLPHLKVYCSNLNRVLHERDVDAPEAKPSEIRFVAHMPAGTHTVSLWNAVPGPNPYDAAHGAGDHRYMFLSLKDGRPPFARKVTDDNLVPLVPILIVDGIEWDGPIRPSADRLLTPGKKDAAHLREVVAAFASRAFRRPATPTEVARYVTVADRGLARGSSFDLAARDAFLAILCAKDFLYLVEGSADAPRRTVTDWELASRLSYLLWSTMPDDRLFGLARADKLHEPAILKAEVARMLADPRAARFAEDFPRQWLHLREVGKFPPDKKLYPDYDDELERSFAAEPTAYFRQMLADNRPLDQFLDSDWTMLDAPLARHYGIPDIFDSGMRRVTLPPDSHRGGLLTQAGILSLTSDGTRHRPVHRGKWVLEAILGKSPPPPPPNAGNIAPTPATKPKASLRVKLEAHRSNVQCAGCHSRIDPFGLAFENYDAVGRWRTRETVSDGAGENPEVDASGVLPDGRKFADAAGLKKLLASDRDRFAEVFAEQLATYALRRGIGLADRDALVASLAPTRAAGYRLRDVVEALILSELFRTR